MSFDRGQSGQGEHGQGDVGVPAPVAADLVVIQTGLVLGLLEAFLDVPARPGGPGQVEQGGAAGAVADVVGDLGRVVATENNSLYAFQARSGKSLWRTHLGPPVSGGDLPCGNIDPSGITGTPVIDADSNVIYAVAFERGPRHVLVALDAGTGRVRWSRAIDPPGADPRVEQQRAALAWSRGRVYVAYGGLYGDCGDYHGWVVGASSTGAGSKLISYRVPSQREGGIWAPSGPAVDSTGDLYVATGNGSSSSFDYGNAVIRLSPRLHSLDFFAPVDAGNLNDVDADLGSTGPLLLPGGQAFAIGKSGVGFLLDAGKLGGIGHPLAQTQVCDQAFGGVAYASRLIYIPCASGIVAVRARGTTLQRVWLQPTATSSPVVAGAGVWSIGHGTLYQLDARTGAVRSRLTIGDSAHFATPTVSGGKVFVATDTQVFAFG